MSEFAFAFSLLGLLLGFSLVEMLRGLARTIEAQLRAVKLGPDGAAPFRAGWLTPLLALYVMLDVLSFWGSAWVARGELSFSGPVALGALFFTGSYFLAAHLIFPTEPADWADLDAHYFRVRRIVFGALIALATLQTAFMLTIPGVAEAMQAPVVLGSGIAMFVLLAAAWVVRGKAASMAVLVLLIVRYLVQYLA